MITDNSPEGGENLVTLRQRANLTQEGLANELHVTHHTVRNWEKGRAEPRLTISQWKALHRALNIKKIEDLPDSLAVIDESKTGLYAAEDSPEYNPEN